MKKLLFLILCSLSLNVFSAESADALPNRTLNDDRTEATLAAARYGFQRISDSQSNNCECKKELSIHEDLEKSKKIAQKEKRQRHKLRQKALQSTSPFATSENGASTENPWFLDEDLHRKLSEIRQLADMHKDILDMQKKFKKIESAKK